MFTERQTANGASEGEAAKSSSTVPFWLFVSEAPKKFAGLQGLRPEKHSLPVYMDCDLRSIVCRRTGTAT